MQYSQEYGWYYVQITMYVCLTNARLSRGVGVCTKAPQK